MPEPIKIPKVNANDVEAKLVGWLIEVGQRVQLGQAICEIETTKATVEISAEADGYLFPIADEGQIVSIGTTIGWLMPSGDRDAFVAFNSARTDLVAPENTEIMISSKAKAAMESYGLVIADFPGLTVIRVADVEACLRNRSAESTDETYRTGLDNIVFDSMSIAVIGTGSQALTVADAIEAGGYDRIACFLDHKPRAAEFLGYPVYHLRLASELYKRGLRRVHISASSQELEERIVQEISMIGLKLVNICHPSAIVSKSARLGQGVYLGPLTYIGPNVVLGDRVRVLNCASVAHDSAIGVGSHIADGARIAGHVHLDRDCLIGLGSTVNKYVSVGARCIVVSGMHVHKDIPSNHVLRADGNVYPNPL
jgi:sugar O-acyltransferase (sialic acid O-acetyltransferase NeuD family)